MKSRGRGTTADLRSLMKSQEQAKRCPDYNRLSQDMQTAQSRGTLASTQNILESNAAPSRRGRFGGVQSAHRIQPSGGVFSSDAGRQASAQGARQMLGSGDSTR